MSNDPGAPGEYQPGWSAKWHRARRSKRNSISAGSSATHRSPSEYGQRGWNRQPLGGRSIDGGEPEIGCSRRAPRRWSRRGTDSSRPHV